MKSHFIYIFFMFSFFSVHASNEFTRQNVEEHVRVFEFLRQKCEEKGHEGLLDGEACQALKKMLGKDAPIWSATRGAQSAWAIAAEAARECRNSSRGGSCDKAEREFKELVLQAEIVAIARSRCPLPKLSGGGFADWPVTARNECEYLRKMFKEAGEID